MQLWLRNHAQNQMILCLPHLRLHDHSVKAKKSILILKSFLDFNWSDTRNFVLFWKEAFINDKVHLFVESVKAIIETLIRLPEQSICSIYLTY